MALLFLIFLLPLISFIGYLCKYSQLLYLMFWFLFCAYALTYVVYFGMITKPERSLYAYLFLWCFFPKRNIPADSLLGVLNMPDLVGVSLFSMLEIIAVIAIIAALLLRGRRWAEDRWKGFYLLLLAASFFSILSYFYMKRPTAFPIIPGEGLYKFLHIMPLFYGLIFLSGAAAFIKKRVHVEAIMTIFLLTGITLTIELIVFKYLKLFPALHYWAFLRGRLNSLIFYDFTIVGLISMISILCALYFIFTRKRYMFLLGAPLLFLPIIGIYQRAHIIATLMALAFFFWLILPGRRRMLFISISGIVLLCLFVLINYNQVFVSKVEMVLSGEARPGGYFNTDSFFTRLGIWSRASDIFLFSFPLGVGAGMLPYYMSSSSPRIMPVYSSHYSVYDRPIAQIIYDQIVSGERTTGAHNFYLSFVTEYGIFGVAALIIFMLLILRNYVHWRRSLKSNAVREKNIFAVGVCTYSILAGLGVYNLFYHPYRLYFLYFIFFYLTFLLPRLDGESLAAT